MLTKDAFSGRLEHKHKYGRTWQYFLGELAVRSATQHDADEDAREVEEVDTDAEDLVDDERLDEVGSRAVVSRSELIANLKAKAKASKVRKEKPIYNLHPVKVFNHSRVEIAPWGHKWPELMDYYIFNLPDFSGVGQFDEKDRYDPDYAVMAAQGPTNMTGQILVAEEARADNRLLPQQISWIKGQLLKSLQCALADPKQAVNPATFSAVTALAIFAYVRGEFEEGQLHIQGLCRMLTAMGGLDAMRPYPAVRNIGVFIDALISYYSGLKPLMEPEMRIICEQSPLRPGHPFRIAVLPLRSNIPESRIRNQHMLTLSPALQPRISYLHVIARIAGDALVPPYRVAPSVALSHARMIEDALVSQANCSASIRLQHPMFSEVDRLNFDEVLEMMRTSTLILITQLIQRILYTPIYNSRYEFSIAAQAAVPMERLTERHPELSLWALCIRAWHHEGLVGDQAAEEVKKLCARLSVHTVDGLRRYLSLTLFVPALMEQELEALWIRITEGLIPVGRKR